MATAREGKTETLRDWIVAIQCTVLIFFYGGLQRTGALLFVECMSRYNVNREKASIPFTLSYLFLFLLGPLVGILGTRFQIRTIITVGSVLSSVGVFANFWAEDVTFLSAFWGVTFGSGMVFAVALIQEVYNRHFDKHLATAFGLFLAGSSIGGVVITYVSKFLLDYYGLSGTFLILGGLTLNTIPIALSLPVYPKTTKTINQPINKNTQNDGNSRDIHSNELKTDNKNIFYIEHKPQTVTPSEAKTIILGSKTVFHRNCYTVNKKQKTDKPLDEKPSLLSSCCSPFRIFLNPTFLAIGFIQSSFLFVVTILNITLVDICLEKGITKHESVYVLMVVSIMDILGRVGIGWIADCGFIKAVNFLVGSFVLLGVSVLMYIWTYGFAMSIVSSVLYGTLYGIVISFSPKLIKDHIDPEERTMAVSSQNFIFSPVAVALPFILGYFKDTIKSYDGLMYAMVAICILAAVLTFIVPHLAKRQQNSLRTTDPEQRF